MKHLVAKTAEHGSLDCDEFSSGIIEWVNTPKAHGLSPAEILYGCCRNKIFIRPIPTEGGDLKEEMMTSDERHVHFKDEVFPPSATSRRSVRQKRFSNHLRDFV